MSGIIKAAQRRLVWAATLVSLAVPAAHDLSAQDPSAQGLASHDAVLHIAVVSGEGVTHAPGEHVAKPVTVQVTDGTGRPVEGARVSFQVPPEGPGGVFSSGLGTDLAITDAGGHATVRSLQLNRTAGRCLIRVTAAKEQARAGIVLQQYISDPTAAPESADRTAPLAVPAKASPPLTSRAAPPPQVNAAEMMTAGSPLQPKKAPEPKTLAAAILPSKSVVEPAEDTVQPKPAAIRTIVITRGSGKPVAGAIVSGGSTPQKNGSHKKWIWIAILAAGGVGGAFAGSSMAAAAIHNSTTAATVTAPVTIGTPTINIGKP